MMPGPGTPGQPRFANSPGRFLCQVSSSHTPGIFWLGLNVSQEILEVSGKDLCRVHVKPSSFPVEAEVIEVDKNGQHVKKKLLYGRFGNGTRPITDPTERERYKAQVWGP